MITSPLVERADRAVTRDLDMNPDQFRQQMRAHRTAEPVLRVFRTQVLPRVRGPDLIEYLRAVMAKAKNLNEGLGALDEAIPLWCEVYAHNDAEGKEAVIRTLMSVASSRLGGREELRETDVPAAVRLYEAAFRLNHSADQNLRIVKTMMSAANRYSETAGPASAMNIVAAVQLWTGAYRLHLSDDDQGRIIRTMMDIANRLSNTDTPARIDVDAALRIWKGLASLDSPDDAHTRLRRTMMDVANRLRDLGRVDDVIAIWRVVHRLEPELDGRMRVIKTVMSFANELTDTDRSTHDVLAAIRLWEAVLALSTDDAERQRVAATMMAVAGRFGDIGAMAGALLMWRAVARHGGALPVQKSILGARRQHARLSTGPARRRWIWTNAFDLSIHVALLDDEARFDDVIAASGNPSAAPAVRALHADALRKLKRYDEAIKAARQIVDERADTIERQDAKVSHHRPGVLLLREGEGGRGRD